MRSSGILLPISSLPSPFGIGTLGQEAFHFIDFLKDSGQRYWQILPLCPTGYGDSPYQSFSSFACNPYYIDLDILVADGLLSYEDIDQSGLRADPNRVDYENLFEKRFNLLRIAVNALDKFSNEFVSFQKENAFWLEDYALFMAIKAENHMVAFQNWPEPLRIRDKETLEEKRQSLWEEIHFWSALQFLFYSQWQNVKRYAKERNIQIIGDIPIYVSPDSADLWANSKLFQVDENKHMIEVAGCPPDGFSEDGQLWGNPLYDWDYHRDTDFQWWIQRVKYAATLYDLVRIDHFRGFAGYYAIPAGEQTARNGRWREGPGKLVIDALKKSLPYICIIAEDLGYLTKDVKRLLKYSGFPGMKVLQFAFDSSESSDYLPHNHKKNCVIYTGTHDNTTTTHWVSSAPSENVAFAKEYLGVDSDDQITEQFIRTAFSSVAQTAIIPMADWLELGSEARINAPSTLGNNWVWRLSKESLTLELSQKIKRFSKIYGRR